MDVPINYLAIGLATIAAMVIGWLWYGPAFGKPWRRLSGLDTRTALSPAVVYPITLVASATTAFVIAYVSGLAYAFFQSDFLVRALFSAFFLWLGLSAARALIVTLFEARPIRLFLINSGHNLAVVLAMALIIGAFGV